MDLWRIAVRAVIAYAYLFVLARGSGRRVVSQSSPFDFLVALIVGDVFDNAVWGEVSMAKFAAAAGSVFVCDAIMKLLAHRWPRFLHIANGTPRAVVRDGSHDREALRREQLNESELAHLLRLHGLDGSDDVQFALLERNHQLSVVLTSDAQPAQKQDLA
jgi:uncharacterized membrane protein YcaP (DUF421 family)